MWRASCIALGDDVRQVPLTLTARRRSLPRLRRFALRFELIHADMAAELALASSGMTTPARSSWRTASVPGYRFGVGLPRVSPRLSWACSLRNFRQIDIDVL